MQVFKYILVICSLLLLNSCASSYRTVNPKSLHYISNNSNNGVTLQYKYDLLRKKYAKKELKKGVKLVAIKVTNNTDDDLIFGKDIKLFYENQKELLIMDNEIVFKSLKQSPTSYLWYLLLTPVNFYTTSTNSYGIQEETSSTPIGLVIGPGLAGGNMIAASSANKKFKTDLLNYNITGTSIKKGETAYGLIGIRTDSFNAIKVALTQE